MKKWFFYALPVALSMLSCSVKENRMECPCLLDITLAGGTDSKTVVGVWRGSLVNSCSIGSYSRSKRYGMDIPRGHFTMSACSGLRHKLPRDGNLMLEKGEEMDELYAGISQLEAFADTVYGSVSMHRQFAFVNVRVLCLSVEQMPQDIIMKGCTGGLDLRTLAPLRGEYEVTLHPIFGEFCRASVPRQLDNSLKMAIDGVGEIPIGEYIADSGYDWTAEDLADIELVIDFVECKVTLRVAGWNEGRIFALTI